MAEELFSGVGESARVDHVALQSAFDMLTAATTLFEKLGFTIDQTRKAGDDWRKKIFLIKEGSIPLQLTESSDCSSVEAGENHVAIMVDSPYSVALEMLVWATEQGDVDSKIEEVGGGGKYFVYLPAILTVPVELVPNSPCPDCKGRGIIRWRHNVALGFVDVECKTCRGKGTV